MTAILKLLLAATLFSAAFAHADEQPQPKLTPQQTAGVEAVAAATEGPAQIALGDQASLALSEGQLFIPRDKAIKLLTQSGHPTSDNFFGMVIPADPSIGWMVFVDLDKSGYVRETEAKTLNAKALLESLREATRNPAARGDVITDWLQPPVYDAAAHSLSWSVKTRSRNAVAGATDDNNTPVIHNVYVLGRQGHVQLIFLTRLGKIESFKPVFKALPAGVRFNTGKRYEDFSPGEDRVAAYGLAALLIGGIAAKELGLFAIVAAFVLKFAKVIAIAVAAGLAIIFGLKKHLGRQRGEK